MLEKPSIDPVPEGIIQNQTLVAENLNTIPTPQELPPPYSQHPDAPIIFQNQERLEHFKKVWQLSGGKPETLELLLSKVTIVTPELHQQTYQKIIEYTLKLLEEPDVVVSLITPGKRSGRQMRDWFENAPEAEILRQHPRVQQNSLRLSAEHGNRYADIENTAVLTDPNRVFIYIDDWILSGQKCDERFLKIREKINSITPELTPQFAVVVGGITPLGYKRTSSYLARGESPQAVFTVPHIAQLFSAEEYKQIVIDLEQLQYPGAELDLTGTLTLEWNRAPDNFCPEFTPLGGLTDPETGDAVFWVTLG